MLKYGNDGKPLFNEHDFQKSVIKTFSECGLTVQEAEETLERLKNDLKNHSVICDKY